MASLGSHRTSVRRGFQSALHLLAFATTFVSGAYAQQTYTDLEARVSGLPLLMSRTHDAADVLATSLDTILHDHTVCCGRDSALEDSLSKADPQSLKDAAAKLHGRHLLSDGRPIMVTAEFWTTDAVNALRFVNSFNDKHALLMAWNSHLYVVYGVVYRWVEDSPDTGPYTVIRKILLLDTRFYDSRRMVEFNRGADDPAQVEGFLTVTFALQ